MNLQDKISLLLAKDRKNIVLGLEPITSLLNALGNPQEKIPPVIHIAGTNGKGSTVAFLRAMLEADGKKAHVYTSPHFVRWNERLVLAGQEVKDDYLLSVLQTAEDAAKKHGIQCSFFELLTAASFLAFAEVPADFVLLETGLGGRLDATNVINNTLCSIITSISKDHTEFLGDTCEKIAYEKACIMKENSTAIVAKASDSVIKVFTDYANAKHTRCFVEGKDFTVTDDMQDCFLYNGQPYPKPALAGRHQYHNAALAITAAKEVLHLPDSAVKKGLQSVKWSGRLQHLTQGKIVNILPKNWELWIDGGHNEGAAAVLADFLPAWQDKPLFGIWGMINTKKPDDFIAPLAKFFTEIHTVEIEQGRSCYSCEHLAETARKYKATAKEAGDFMKAIKTITDTAGKQKTENGRILIFGSLYLLGEVLKENGTSPHNFCA